MVVTFDQPLEPDPALDSDNWFVRWNNQVRGTPAAVAAGNTVTITIAGADPPIVAPNVVSFSPPPFDVLSVAPLLKPTPAFTDFPLV